MSKQAFEVEVYFNQGSDVDSIGTYLVYAVNELEAEMEAIGQSKALINAKANLIRFPDSVDEMDYDGVLTSKGPIADDSGYELDDPKHPTYHDRMSDAADARD